MRESARSKAIEYYFFLNYTLNDIHMYLKRNVYAKELNKYSLSVTFNHISINEELLPKCILFKYVYLDIDFGFLNLNLSPSAVPLQSQFTL